MAGLGLFFASVLAFMNQKLKVEEDPRVEKIAGVLPGVNCGACGYANCHLYAEALIKGKAQPDQCRAGGEQVASAISEIIGVKVEKRTKEIALILREIYGGDKNIIELASLLHDIAILDGFTCHAKNGSMIVKKIFENELDKNILEKVCYCINHHSIITEKLRTTTSELICVYDADKIEKGIDIVMGSC